jgi:transposase
MGSGFLLPVPTALVLEWVRITPQFVQIGLMSEAGTCRCPACGQCSGRVHSYYTRTLDDVPAHGRVIQLCIGLRRFFCDRRDCSKQTFAEQVPDLMVLRSRKTLRLSETLKDIGLVAGGQAGARLAAKLAMPVSPDTLLRLIRQGPPASVSAPRVLGVDDWAFHRGRRYGTILCDLESHQPIDLLPERSAAVFAAWLQAHPGARIITRDRGGEYARGALQAAPDAIQVADRWHLIHNLAEAFEQALNRQHALLAQAAQIAAKTMRPSGGAIQMAARMDAACDPPTVQGIGELTGRKRRAAEYRSRWQTHFQQVKELQAQSLSLRKIAGQLQLNIHTVSRFAHTQEFPQRASRPAVATGLDGFIPYLKQRWEQGCHNAAQLYRELKQNGFSGSRHMVRRRLAQWRNPQDAEPAATDAQPGPDRKPHRRPSARTVAWMLLNPDAADAPLPAAERSKEQARFLAILHQKWPELAQNLWLIHEFGRVFQERDPANLEAWMSLVEEPGIVPEVKRFAQHLRQDWAAVVEAVRQPWSNGQVEGQVNRLKLIKRLMYGRANFDLLRARVLQMN